MKAQVSADVSEDAALRPRQFDEFVGQKKLKTNLQIFAHAASERGEAVDHLLFCGPPGLGKTSLAQLIAVEMDARLHVTSGRALQKKGDLAGILTGLAPNDVLFIDEIHALPLAIEEQLYPAMEDYKVEVILGQGTGAEAMSIPLPRFTLVGATTRAGQLSAPLRDRFGFVGHLELYSQEELAEIATRSAKRLGVDMDPDGALEVAARSRGTPRLANRFLRRLRDFAQVLGNGRITQAVAQQGLDALEVDSRGLDRVDRRILRALIRAGAPLGLSTLAAQAGEEAGTIADAHEPYLLQEGFIARSPRGRVATALAYTHLRDCQAA